jgi:GT2 family glycosyltransferase
MNTSDGNKSNSARFEVSLPVVSVIVPNWNGRHLLPTCLDALSAQTWQDFEIIVVDNGSTDDSVKWLQEHWPSVQVIANSENLGFAAAVNQGVQASAATFVATLNNDTQVEPGWLAALAGAIESEARVGMCASKMLFAHRLGTINSAGVRVDRACMAWDWLGGEPDVNQGTELVEVFGACAGAALYRRVMLEEIGGFDQDFFMYLEDVDVAWRARLAGWRCLYVPAARVLHRHSASSVEGSPFKNLYSGRSKIWLVIKNYPFPAGLLYLPLVVCYDLGTLPYRQILRGDWSALRGRWEGLAHWRVAWRKRRWLPGRKSPSCWPSAMSPITSLWSVHAHMRRFMQRVVETQA